MYSPPDPMGFPKEFTNSFNEFLAASVISGVVGLISVIAIVIAIIKCLKSAENAIPVYVALQTRDTNKTSEDKALQLAFPVIPDSQIRTATMEKFLSQVARERPLRFSPEQLEGFTNNYTIVLGSGGFGLVYKGEFPNGVEVAVKVLNSTKDKRGEQFMAEVSTIGRTYHVNLVRLYGFCFHSTMRALVYECMENGSLDKFLFTEISHAIRWGKLHEIAIGTAKGIAYLHEECEQRIIHHDIKPENILLDKGLNPKVADFGLARLCNIDDTHVSMEGFKGTLGYAAPELSKPGSVTHKCDVYSFGMLLFEIVGRRRNFDASLSNDECQEWLPRWTFKKFEKNELEHMLSVCGIEESDNEKAERMCMVALWCVQYSPEARPLMSKVVKMLEGGIEITPPPNPFEHLESNGVPTLALMITGSDEGSNSTSSESSRLPKSSLMIIGSQEGSKAAVEMNTLV